MRILILSSLFIIGLLAQDLYDDETYSNEPLVKTNKMVRKKSNTKSTQTSTRKNLKNKQVKTTKRTTRDKENSGWMLGVGGNISIFIDDFSNKYSGIATGGGFDIVGGYKWFFSQGFGMRLYAQYNPSFVREIKADIYTYNDTYNYSYSYGDSYTRHTLALNYDLLFNWVKTHPFKFGMILGFGTGIDVVDFKHLSSETLFAVIGNLGFRFVIFNNHAIETTAHLKIAVGGTTTYKDLNAYGGYTYMPFSFAGGASVRYVYTF